MVPRVGQKIGPYEILGRLGSGGMGLVFSAWDARLHRDVAIKLLKDEYLNPTMRSRFLGEARAASRLNHPNICTIFDIGEEQDCPYMVMELLKGETLRGLMQQGSISTETILQVATQTADALSVAHEQGIVHRDIKPANVVLVDKPNGTFQTKVLDFGLAKVDMGLDSHSGLTTTGMTVGTVSYMSPEQARGELLDGRSDLFSLGVVLYEMATKKLPFDGATSALIFVKLLNHPPEPLRNLNAAMPRSLEQVISTCLQKNRDDRYQTAQELVTALHKAAQQIGSGERSASWFAKFTTGLKRESAASSSQQEPSEPEGLPEGPSPLQLSAEEAFLRPFKPVRRPSSGSKHYEPVNAPYSPDEEAVEPPSRSQELAASAAAVSPEDARYDEEHAAEPGSIPVPNAGETQASHSRIRALDWLDEPVEAPPHDEFPIQEENAPSWRAWRVLLGCLLAASAVAISVAVVLSKRQPTVAKLAPTVIISEIANHTGDNTLGSVMAAGLELSLQQSQVIGLRGSGSHPAELVSEVPQMGEQRFAALQQAAKAGGAAAFVLGEIRMEGPTYSLSLHVYETNKGSAIGECVSTALSRERMVGAVDGLATNLRSVLGEGSPSINASLPLSKEATGNIDALSAYELGNTLLASGRHFDAMYAFEHAVAIDPQFTQAHLRLAELYMQQHAELGAAAAAQLGVSTANGDDRVKLLADGLQALLGSGDLQKAADRFSQVTKHYAFDATGFRWLAVAQRLQGAYPAALASAQEAVRLAPEDADAVNEWKLNLIALDPASALLQVDARNANAGPLAAADLLANFLHGAAVSLDAQTAITTSDDLDTQVTEAAILDASGQLNAGLAIWRTIAQRAAAAPQLASSAAFALSQAAFDRALSGDCKSAFGLRGEASGYPAGPQALFLLGMASGLCGNIEDTRMRLNVLTSTYAQSFHVKSFYASDLNALIQWKAGALADSLVTLQSASNYDAISLTPYLRGQVYLAQKQPQPATVDFQSMLRHQGQVVLMNVEALPMTRLALARAFVANGDPANAAQSYEKLATMFEGADADNPVLTEASLAAAH